MSDLKEKLKQRLRSRTITGDIQNGIKVYSGYFLPNNIQRVDANSGVVRVLER